MHTKFRDKYFTLRLSIIVYENKINDLHGIKVNTLRLSFLWAVCLEICMLNTRLATSESIAISVAKYGIVLDTTFCKLFNS